MFCMHLSIRKWQCATMKMHRINGKVETNKLRSYQAHFNQQHFVFANYVCVCGEMWCLWNGHNDVKPTKLIQIKLKFLLTYLIMACQKLLIQAHLFGCENFSFVRFPLIRNGKQALTRPICTKNRLPFCSFLSFT